jgi:regulatory protein
VSADERVPDALAAATRALAARDHTRASLGARLARRGIADEDTAAAIDVLAAAGYVDDRRFAHGRAGALAARGVGDAAIADDLRRQGVPDELAMEAVAALEPEPLRAERVAEARGWSLRTVRLLASRGFDEASLERLVAEIQRGTVG